MATAAVWGREPGAALSPRCLAQPFAAGRASVTGSTSARAARKKKFVGGRLAIMEDGRAFGDEGGRRQRNVALWCVLGVSLFFFFAARGGEW